MNELKQLTGARLCQGSQFTGQYSLTSYTLLKVGTLGIRKIVRQNYEFDCLVFGVFQLL